MENALDIPSREGRSTANYMNIEAALQDYSYDSDGEKCGLGQ